MNCEEFRDLLDPYIDGELDQEQRARLLGHAEACPGCAAELRGAEALKHVLAGLDQDPVVPLAAQAGWRTAVKKEARRRKIKYVYRAAGAVAAAFVVLVSGTFAMRGAGLLENRTAREAAVTAEAPENEGEAALRYFGQARPMEVKSAGAALETDGEADFAEAADELPLDEEIIFDSEEAMLAAEPVEDAEALYAALPASAEAADDAADLEDAAEEALESPTEAGDAGTDMETASDEALLVRSAFREIYTDSFDAAHAQIGDLAGEYGGYLRSDAVTNGEGARRAEMVAAVPEQDLDAFLTALDYLGTVTQAEISTEDITLNYYDAQGRLDALSAERDRLSALLAEAQDAEEMAALDAQLEDVFARIDALEGDFRAYESELQLARVRVTLHEGEPGAVGAIPEEKLGQRMDSGFKGTWRSLKQFFADMAVSLAVLAPVAAIALPVIAVVWVLVALLVRRRRRVREEE